MELPILYKRAKTGKIQYWKIETDESGTGFAFIKKESGQLGTKNPLHHAEQVHEGKQKRSYMEQADSQAQSDWKGKRDDGYKSLEDLGITDHGTHVSANGQDLSLEEMLEVQLPQFNTDANGNVKPMLATDLKKIKHIPYPVLVQPKLDGIRCLMVCKITDYPKDHHPRAICEVTFLSRKGKEFTTLDHIRQDVLRWWEGLPAEHSFILDGEIYSEEISFQEILQATKKQYPNSLKLRFRCYDIVNESSQEDRVVAESRDMIAAINSPLITAVPYKLVNSLEEVKELHDEHVKNGSEGAMIRLLDARYEQGARSRALIKVKMFDETEFPIVAFTQGQREQDVKAVCPVPLNYTGRELYFYPTMMGSVAVKAALIAQYGWDTPIMGKRLTVKHFGYTDEGLPRHPNGKAIRDYE